MSADINRARRRITAACNEQGISRKKYKKNRRKSRMASAIKRGYLSVAAANLAKAIKRTSITASEAAERLKEMANTMPEIPSKAIAEMSFKPTWRLYLALAALAGILVALMIYVL